MVRPTVVEALMATDDEIRAWAVQERPVITAPNLRSAMDWLVRHDDLLPSTFGSYKKAYASPRDQGRALRGYRGTLLAIFYGYRPGYGLADPNREVQETVDMWTNTSQPVLYDELP